MSYADTQAALEKHLQTHWTATPIFWPNITFDPPRDAAGNETSYLACVIREDAANEITLGSENPWNRNTGIAMIQIFTPENQGPFLSRQYADQLKGIFKRVVAVNEATDISVLSTDGSFNSVTTDFITAGFTVGSSFTFAGFLNVGNNGVFIPTVVTQRKLRTASVAMVTETAGLPISVHGVKTFNYRNSGVIRPRLADIFEIGRQRGWYQTNVSVPYIRDYQS